MSSNVLATCTRKVIHVPSGDGTAQALLLPESEAIAAYAPKAARPERDVWSKGNGGNHPEVSARNSALALDHWPQLHPNRTFPWVDIDSHLPFTGRVDLKLKTAADVQVRLPAGTALGEVRCVVNENPRDVGWHGRFAQVGSVGPGDRVTLTFPISERLETLWVEKRGYRAVFRGNTCVAINPPGTNSPLFQRQYLRSENTRWRQQERFVPRQSLTW